MNGDNPEAAARFKEVTEAYNVLSDKEKKKLYDQFGHAAFDGSGNTSDFYKNGNGSYQEFHFEGGDMEVFGRVISARKGRMYQLA